MSTSIGSRCAYHPSVASTNSTSLYGSNYAATNRSLNASVMTDLYASMLLYIVPVGEIESIVIMMILSIRWCTCEINSYKVVLFTPYPMAKLFEFQEGDVISTMVSMDMCEILCILWEKDSLNFLELFVEVITPIILDN